MYDLPPHNSARDNLQHGTNTDLLINFQRLAVRWRSANHDYAVAMIDFLPDTASTNTACTHVSRKDAFEMNNLVESQPCVIMLIANSNATLCPIAKGFDLCALGIG